MPLAPVVTRSPASTGVPRAGVERCPLAFCRLTSPVTNVNSPLAAPASTGGRERGGEQSVHSGADGSVHGVALRARSCRSDRGADLAAFEVVDVDVGAVVRIGVLQPQGALLAELPGDARLASP